MIQEKKWDNTPEDELRHDVTDELAAYKLASLPFPGVFGVFYETDRPTKNALEKKWIENTREKIGNASDLEVLQKTFAMISECHPVIRIVSAALTMAASRTVI